MKTVSLKQSSSLQVECHNATALQSDHVTGDAVLYLFLLIGSPRGLLGMLREPIVRYQVGINIVKT